MHDSNHIEINSHHNSTATQAQIISVWSALVVCVLSQYLSFVVSIVDPYASHGLFKCSNQVFSVKFHIIYYLFIIDRRL